MSYLLWFFLFLSLKLYCCDKVILGRSDEKVRHRDVKRPAYSKPAFLLSSTIISVCGWSDRYVWQHNFTTITSITKFTRLRSCVRLTTTANYCVQKNRQNRFGLCFSDLFCFLSLLRRFSSIYIFLAFCSICTIPAAPWSSCDSCTKTAASWSSPEPYNHDQNTNSRPLHEFLKQLGFNRYRARFAARPIVVRDSGSRGSCDAPPIVVRTSGNRGSRERRPNVVRLSCDCRAIVVRLCDWRRGWCDWRLSTNCPDPLLMCV